MEGHQTGVDGVKFRELEAVLSRFQAWSSERAELDQAPAAPVAGTLSQPMRGRVAQRLKDELELRSAVLAVQPRAAEFEHVLAQTVAVPEELIAERGVGVNISPEAFSALRESESSEAVMMLELRCEPGITDRVLPEVPDPSVAEIEAGKRRPAAGRRQRGLSDAALVPAKKKTASRKPSRRLSDSGALAASAELLQLTDAEQAKLRARAAEAGLPVSAYIRQCVVEVEVLRGIVDRSIAGAAAGRAQNALRLTGAPGWGNGVPGGRVPRVARWLAASLRSLLGRSRSPLSGTDLTPGNQEKFGSELITLGLHAERRGLPQIPGRDRGRAGRFKGGEQGNWRSA